MPNEIIKTFKGWPNLKSRFLSKLPENYKDASMEDVCWNWQGNKTSAGYGKIHWHTSYLAHRLSYLIFTGISPQNKVVRHTCDNPACVNPKHLILGTSGDNSVDMIKRNRGGHQRLNSEAVKVIKWMLKYRNKYGMVAKLARLHGVSKDQISRINNNRHWAWIKV